MMSSTCVYDAWRWLWLLGGHHASSVGSCFTAEHSNRACRSAALRSGMSFVSADQIRVVGCDNLQT